jgi:hypothetical protein
MRPYANSEVITEQDSNFCRGVKESPPQRIGGEARNRLAPKRRKRNPHAQFQKKT